MTPADLRAWQKRMGYTYDTAADALGIARRTYASMVGGDVQIDRRTALACAAIAAGIGVWESTGYWAVPNKMGSI